MNKYLKRMMLCAALCPISLGVGERSVRRSASAPPAALSESGVQQDELYRSLPLTFETNVGQTDPRVAFVARNMGHTTFFTSDELVTKLRRLSTSSTRGKVTVQSSSVLRTKFIGSNPNVAIQGQDRQAGTTHYLLGSDPHRWRTGVSSFSGILYNGIYPGIDLVFYGNQRHLEYDFIVAPRADPSSIRFQISGAVEVRIDHEGSLVMSVEGAEVVHHAPFIYQRTDDGITESVEGRYRLNANNEVAFEVPRYDRNRTLFIDPVFSYSTYLGGTGDDFLLWSHLDEDGHLFVTGATSSLDFPTSAGSLHPNESGGFDAFVTKFKTDGSGLVYSTYLGGSGDDFGFGISVARGNAYVVGSTSSVDFPTKHAIQPHFAGGPEDGFVACLDPSGAHLIYSTYLGGNGDDVAIIGPTHSDGTIWVYGFTSSENFPITPRAFQRSFGGGNYDAFVTKIDSTGQRLVFSSYLGGSGDDLAFDGTVDEDGHAHIAGFTSSIDFPVTRGAFQTTFGGGDTDAFAAKVSLDGSHLVYATYIGGSGHEEIRDGRVDESGNFYIPGFTNSLDFPIVSGAFQPTYAGGPFDGFIVVLNSRGSKLLWSTYFGGSGDDLVGGLHPDECGNLFFAGRTNSTDLPTTANARQRRFGGGNYDSFVGEFRLKDAALVYSSYFGGDGYDEAQGSGVNIDDRGNVYVVGNTNSTNLYTSANAFQRSLAGQFDGFAYKVAFHSCGWGGRMTDE